MAWTEAELFACNTAPDSTKSARWYHFTRVRVVGSKDKPLVISKEELEFVLDMTEVPERPKGTVKIVFSLLGHYLIDGPSKFPSMALGKVMGEYEMFIGWVFLPL